MSVTYIFDKLAHIEWLDEELAKHKAMAVKFAKMYKEFLWDEYSDKNDEVEKYLEENKE